MSKIRNVAVLLAAAGLTLNATSALAGHPRIHEVNARLENQGDRIHAGAKGDQLTSAEAQGLRKDDRMIRREEHSMAKLDGGHLTKADQKALNQQLNAVGEQIKDERH